MDLGVVTDLPSVALRCVKAGAKIVILSGHLKSPGGGVTPTVGLIRTFLQKVSECPPQTYALLRPSIGGFRYGQNEDERSILLADLDELTKVDGLKGVMVGVEGPERSLDCALAREIVQRAGHLEVWYHRGAELLGPSESVCKSMAEVGVTGVIIGLLGETAALIAKSVSEKLERVEQSGMRAMICGTVASTQVGGLAKDLERFVQSHTLRAWCISVPEADEHYGALLPWREWEITNCLWLQPTQPLASGCSAAVVTQMTATLPDDLTTRSGCSNTELFF